MIKKILMTMALLLSLTGTTFAKDIQFRELNAYPNADTIRVSTNAFIRNFEPNPKDWLGIYKVGDSNALDNVKLRVWAKDFIMVDDHGVYGHTFKNIKLPLGQYEARYFLNNSLTTRIKSKPFKIVTSDKIHGIYSPKANMDFNSVSIEIRDKNFNPNPKDWIGIYKKYDSNAWKNVRQWIWAKDLEKNPGNFYGYLFKNPNLESGIYEIRYFLNNTFTTHEQSKPFKVKVDTNNELYGHHNYNKKTTYIEVRNENFKPNPKDWLGVYEVGDSNEWDNVKSWIWAKDLERSPAGYYHQFENVKNIWVGLNLEVRYFLNNSFITDKRSAPFKVEW